MSDNVLPAMTAATIPDKLVWTPRDVASLLGVSEREVQRLCAAGEIDAIKVGRSWRIGRSYILNFAGVA